MDKEKISNALKELKEKGQERKFKQSVDLILTFKNLNMKKPEDQVDFFAEIHYPVGKKIKTCALIGPEMEATAKESCDKYILVDEFSKFAKDKKAIKKLAYDYDFFIAQATVMPKVAAAFGKVLGPRNKMPNPKAGCVVPPNANLKPLVDKLQKLIKITAKISPMVQLIVGKEDMEEEQLIDNIMTLYDSILHHIPSGINNIKSVLLKFTMTKPVKLE